MERLRGLARWETRDGTEACWLPGGMTAVKPDGSLLDSGWRKHPAPVVEPLLTYYRATGDQDGLAFARAYAEGIVRGLQPGGIRFKADGRFDEPLGHSHATMHALWGVNHLGVLTGERRYVDFARRAWDWMLSRGTGTGWFPAMPDSCNETCCVSDMISHAALFGHAGDAEHFDYVERYLRNYIDTLQFVITPEFEDYYREINAGKEPDTLSTPACASSESSRAASSAVPGSTTTRTICSATSPASRCSGVVRRRGCAPFTPPGRTRSSSATARRGGRTGST